jgi:hypothetical protein
MSLPSESNVESLSWSSLPSLPSDGGQETIVETIRKVNNQNKIFHDKFTDVANHISNYKKDKDNFKSINGELRTFLDKVLEKVPVEKSGENSINLTMTILDLIYVNLSNDKDMYSFPDDSDFLTKYDKLKDIEKRYSDLVESYGAK